MPTGIDILVMHQNLSPAWFPIYPFQINSISFECCSAKSSICLVFKMKFTRCTTAFSITLILGTSSVCVHWCVVYDVMQHALNAWSLIVPVHCDFRCNPLRHIIFVWFRLISNIYMWLYMCVRGKPSGQQFSSGPVRPSNNQFILRCCSDWFENCYVCEVM